MYFDIHKVLILYSFYLTIFLSSAESNLCNQWPPRNLQSFNRKELTNFYGSFDTVITDIFAIMRQSSSPSVAVEILKNLQRCHKQNIFLIEDSVLPVQHHSRLLSTYFDFPVNENQFISPHESLLWYLRKFNSNGKAFVVSSDQLLRKLKNAGVNFIPALKYTNTNYYNDNTTIIVDRSVNKVIVDFDITTNLNQIAQAGLYLKNDSVQFLIGTAQKQYYVSKFQKIFGPGYLKDILTNYTGRMPLQYGKPGPVLRDYIMNSYPDIASNPRRVLFIGNSFDVDMKFAYMCGFQKLWLDSDANESIGSKPDNCMTIPDYYLSDISKLRFIGCR